MFSELEWSTLINKLRQLTEKRKIEWHDNRVGGLYASVNDITYLIGSKDSDGVAPYLLSVRRVRSEDDWDELDVLESAPGMETDLAPWTKVEPLRDLALRMSRGGPEVVQNLLAELNDLDPSDPPIYGGGSAPF